MWSRQFRVILSSAQSFTSIWWIAGTSRQTYRKTIHRKMDINNKKDAKFFDKNKSRLEQKEKAKKKKKKKEANLAW